MFDIFCKHLNDAIEKINEGKLQEALSILDTHLSATRGPVDDILKQLRLKLQSYESRIDEGYQTLEKLKGKRPTVSSYPQEKGNIIKNLTSARDALDDVKKLTHRLRTKEKELE